MKSLDVDFKEFCARTKQVFSVIDSRPVSYQNAKLSAGKSQPSVNRVNLNKDMNIPATNYHLQKYGNFRIKGTAGVFKHCIGPTAPIGRRTSGNYNYS